uniref:non-specific serine/threonine protein kinase n=1 Tax=Romanomermis culicivorax TaxID=13658 RepID=A0A915IPL0_ROMCU
MPPKRKAAAGAKQAGGNCRKYAMAPILPAGEILCDFNKRNWVLGRSFASGGFGRIYMAKQLEDKSNKQNFVVKMEPADNGPLFQETSMYRLIGKSDIIQKFKLAHGMKPNNDDIFTGEHHIEQQCLIMFIYKMGAVERVRYLMFLLPNFTDLEFLGIPTFHGSGTYFKDSLNYRFLIMPRFGSDVEKIRESQSSGRFENVTDTCRLILTYLHSQNVVHADLKGENLLLEADIPATSSNLHKSYLADYGLARRVPENAQYKEMPKKAHEGTLIFTSLDAHKGCSPVYRGDTEILDPAPKGQKQLLCCK